MKKLEKSSNKNSTVVFIYGPQAVGKFTVGKILSKKLGYKLAHNHHINDFVAEVFDRGSFASHSLKDQLRYLLMEHMAKDNNNFIVTHCYSHDFVSRTGLSDPKYVENLQKKLIKLGANFYPVHLQASKKELLRRVAMNSRRKFKKLVDKKIMRKLALKHDWQSSPNLKNNLIIDNTKLSPQKVANIITKHHKIK